MNGPTEMSEPKTNPLSLLEQPTEQFAFFLSLLLIFLIPIRNQFPLVFGRTLPAVLGIVLGLVWALSIVASRTIKLTKFHTATVLLVSWAIASIFWSVNTEAASFGLVLKFVMVVVITFVYFNIFESIRRLRYGVVSYLSICSVLSVLTLRRYFQASGATYRPAAFGLNPNQTAFYIVLGLPLAVWLMSSLSEHRVIHNVIVLLYFLVSGSSILVLGSRGAMIAAVPSFLLLWYVFYRSSALVTGSRKVANGFLIISAVSVIVGIYVASTILSGTYIFPRIESIFTEVRTGEFGGTRRTLWFDGWNLFVQSPVLGIGWEAFRFEIEPYAGKAVPPENTYLGVLYQLGIVGFLFFIDVLWTVFGKIRHNIAWAVFTLTVLISFIANDWLHFPILWALLAIMMADLYRANADPTF